MLRAAFLLLLLAIASPAQIVFQAVASQGDGSQCTATQNAGAKVNLTFACFSPIRGLPSETHRIYNAGSPQPRQAVPQTVHFGDIVCMFGVNPTAAPADFGSLGSAPPSSIRYACSLNTRTAGKITGNAEGPSGLVSWQ
jgi:hypothetical protein